MPRPKRQRRPAKRCQQRMPSNPADKSPQTGRRRTWTGGEGVLYIGRAQEKARRARSVEELIALTGVTASAVGWAVEQDASARRPWSGVRIARRACLVEHVLHRPDPALGQEPRTARQRAHLVQSRLDDGSRTVWSGLRKIEDHRAQVSRDRGVSRAGQLSPARPNRHHAPSARLGNGHRPLPFHRR